MLLIKKKKLSSRSMFLDELLGIISLNNCLINERIRSFLISDVLYLDYPLLPQVFLAINVITCKSNNLNFVFT